MIGFGLIYFLNVKYCICLYILNFGYKFINWNVVYYIFKKYSILFINYLKKKKEICFFLKLGSIYKIILGNFKDLKLFFVNYWSN